MTLLGLVLTLVVIGVLLWLLNQYGGPYIDGKVLKIINVVVIVVVILGSCPSLACCRWPTYRCQSCAKLESTAARRYGEAVSGATSVRVDTLVQSRELSRDYLGDASTLTQGRARQRQGGDRVHRRSTI